VFLCCCRSIRVAVRTTGSFTREVPHGIQHVPATFHTLPQLVSTSHQFDFDLLLRDLLDDIDQFNRRGSNFTLDYVSDFIVVLTEYHSLAGSTYLATPNFIEKKKAVINVINNDDRCFYGLFSVGCTHPNGTPSVCQTMSRESTSRWSPKTYQSS